MLPLLLKLFLYLHPVLGVFLGAVAGKDNMKNSGGKYPPDFWERLSRG
jgi:hypothetical protein